MGEKANIEYPFEHWEGINYTIDDVSIQPVTTNILVSFLTQLLERKEIAQGLYEASGDINS
jgi:hypothetical protein